VLYLYLSTRNIFLVAIVFTIIFIGILKLFRLSRRYKNAYKERYKKEIFAALFHEVSFDWSFIEGDTSFVESLFKSSGLYRRYETLKADDVIMAKKDTTKVCMSEISATYTVKTKDSSYTKIIFQGFFIEIEFEKVFECTTYVLGEAESVSLSGYDKKGRRIEETELEWNDFEKFLKVESSHPREAREILTPDFMGVLYDWWSNHKKDLRFVFKDNNMCIAIPSTLTFEGHLIGSKEQEKNIIKEHLELLHFVEETVDILMYHNRLKS